MSSDRATRLGSDVEPGPLSREEQEEFFRRPLIARLATVRPDCAPYINPVWFHWDGTDFFVMARRKAAWVAHLRAHPKVCLSIASDEVPYSRATVIGTAQIANPDGSPDSWVPLLHQMTRRYIGEIDETYASRTARYPRWLIRVSPEEVITWRGGGWARRYFEGEG